jgi:hypothetical protein
MEVDLKRTIVENFLNTSRSCIEALIKELEHFSGNKRKQIKLFSIDKGKIEDYIFDGGQFFLRSSVEYSNPQLTVEEVQGVIAARLLDVCGNYFRHNDVQKVERDDIDEICEMLIKPPSGLIIPFLLNTDDVEPDRYSINPLRKSIVKSGQSAFPAASVKTEELQVDQEFVKKYMGTLISKGEIEQINHQLENSIDSYMDFVDRVKYCQLENLSKEFEIDLCIPTLRLPLTRLQNEEAEGILHDIISESHKGYESIQKIYDCMGRSMKKRRTLLTIPHSKEGFGSKRSARGRIYFEGTKLKGIRVTYKKTPLYPNAIDPEDVSIAVAENNFIVKGEKLSDYDYRETPSSPQFILYSLASPENAVIWHGIGAFGASKLVKSFTTIHQKYANQSIFSGLQEKHRRKKPPLQINVVPENMWVHPEHRNIDASIGTISNLSDLANMGLKLEYLLTSEYSR